VKRYVKNDIFLRKTAYAKVEREGYRRFCKRENNKIA